MPEITMVAALNEALRDSLKEDPRVLVLGEDVSRSGGVFRVTDRLQEEFGAERVFDTPIAEAGIAGAAVGLALAGWRPVVEMQFDGFSYPALDQVISHVAKYRYRTRGRAAMPIVLRIPSFGGIKGKEHHGESPETYYVHTAGLKVVVPSTPDDAYRLLVLAIRDPDPVVVLEPKSRYWAKAPVEELTAGGPGIGEARVVRDGDACAVFAYGAMVHRSLQAAEGLAGEGIDARIVDLRSLAPLDVDAIGAAVRETGRAVVVHEAPMTLGMGAEVVARIVEEAFDHLEAPVMRVTGFDTPYPPASLEDRWLPSVERIGAAVREAVAYRCAPGRPASVVAGEPNADGEPGVPPPRPRRGARGGRDRRVARGRRRPGPAEPAARRGRDREGHGRDPLAVRRRRRGDPRGRGDDASRRGTARHVRRLAKELGVDLAALGGTGPGGRITREDVERAASALFAERAASAASTEQPDEAERVPISPIRRAIADNLARAVREVPQVTAFRTVGCTALEAFRAELGTSPLPIVVRALAEICAAHPQLNASYRPEEGVILVPRRVHVGVATDTDRGLMVPVVRDVGSLGIAEVAETIGRLARSARKGSLTPGDMRGGTITVTNTASYGSEAGTPIINPPEAAILALGVIEPRALVVDGRVEARPACTLSLTFDHRVLDGATAGRAFGDLVALLEDAERLRSLPR